MILTFPFTARKAKVLATTMAALDDNPEPAGTDPVTSRSAGIGTPFSPEK
jgi:hypothetical protein